MQFPTRPKFSQTPRFLDIKFPNHGTIRLEITIAGLLPSVIVLRTPVSKNETSSGGDRRQAIKPAANKPDASLPGTAAGGTQQASGRWQGGSVHAFDAKVRSACGGGARRRAVRRQGPCRRLSGASDRIDRAVGPGRRRRSARPSHQQAHGADARAGHSGGERARRHRRDRHGEASVRARRRLFDGDLHRRQPRAARRQKPALDDERHHAGGGDDQGPVLHLREAGQPDSRPGTTSRKRRRPIPAS